jgi:hypothetical protein
MRIRDGKKSDPGSKINIPGSATPPESVRAEEKLPPFKRKLKGLPA